MGGPLHHTLLGLHDAAVEVMALIIRLDIDRPYGKRPIGRHILSRVCSDLGFPRLDGFGFLGEVRTMLMMLNEANARAYVFFRRCTLPSRSIIDLIDSGGHEIGLHLENSRSFSTFAAEAQVVETHIDRKVLAVSKHGSGRAKLGLHHYPPYEPERYVAWASRLSMRVFLGNLEDPTLEPADAGSGLVVFPSAFWLEPPWRNTASFTVEWLLEHARHRDIVLLVHPENVLADRQLVADFNRLITSVESKIFP